MGYDSSRVELIGPFDVAWNTTGIAAGFIAVPGGPDLPVGTDIVKAWAEVTTAWNSATSDALSLGVSKADALATAVTIATYDAKAAVSATSNANVEPVSTVQKAASVLQDSVLSIKVTSAGGSLSAGAAKVFALIAHPSGTE